MARRYLEAAGGVLLRLGRGSSSPEEVSRSRALLRPGLRALPLLQYPGPALHYPQAKGQAGSRPTVRPTVAPQQLAEGRDCCLGRAAEL